MMPAGPLMIEHRLIERMIKLLEKELKAIEEKKEVDLTFIDDAVDFIKTYADRCHHVKEEDILFRELKKKDISNDHNRILDELIEEHICGRETTKKLSKAKKEYAEGDKSIINDIADQIKKLVELYPRYIKKEDKDFFIPVIEYFTREEQEDMLEEFWDFDKQIIHKKYKNVVESYG